MNADKELMKTNEKRKRQRSVAIAWALVAFMALFFVVTIVRLGGNVFNRP